MSSFTASAVIELEKPPWEVTRFHSQDQQFFYWLVGRTSRMIRAITACGRTEPRFVEGAEDHVVAMT